MLYSGKIIVGVVILAAFGCPVLVGLHRMLLWRINRWADAMIGAFGLMRVEDRAHREPKDDPSLVCGSCVLPRIKRRSASRPRPAMTRQVPRSVAYRRRPSHRHRYPFAGSPHIWSVAAHQFRTLRRP